MRKYLLFCILILRLPSLSPAFAEDLNVAVAANVQYTFQELKSNFEDETDLTIREIIGSSGNLTSQIENGAPFDLFLSADMDYPEALYEKGLTHQKPEIYAYGTLVLWTLANLDFSKGIEILNDPIVRKVAIPNPQTSPYGRQAANVLKHYKIYDQLSRKLVYGESIAQVSQFIASRASDIGFTAKSIVLAPDMLKTGQWTEVEPDAYAPIAQGVVILKHAEEQNLEAAQKFYDFLFSEKARAIYKKYGYVYP